MPSVKWDYNSTTGSRSEVPFKKIKNLEENSQDVLQPLKRFSVFSWGSQGHKIGVGTPQLLPRLTWCREDLAAEGHGAERTARAAAGAFMVLRDGVPGLSVSGARWTCCLLLPLSLCSRRPSPWLFIKAALADGEVESGGEEGKILSIVVFHAECCTTQGPRQPQGLRISKNSFSPL